MGIEIHVSMEQSWCNTGRLNQIEKDQYLSSAMDFEDEKEGEREHHLIIIMMLGSELRPEHQS